MALVLLGAEPRAEAGSCGAGSDGGSSDSSSSDSGGGGGGSDTSTPACIEESDVHGRRVCSGYGATWAMGRFAPALTVESAVAIRSVSLSRYAFGGEVDHGVAGTYQYSLVGEDLGSTAHLVSGDLRVLGGRRFYGGAELQLGGVAADEEDMLATTTGELDSYMTATMQPTVQMVVGYGGVLGVRVPIGKLRASAEVFAGGQTLQLAVDSQLGSCETVTHAYASRFVVEPRARLEAWISPWMSLGAFAGADLTARESRSFGVFLAGHTRAFDGGR